MADLPGVLRVPQVGMSTSLLGPGGSPSLILQMRCPPFAPPAPLGAPEVWEAFFTPLHSSLSLFFRLGHFR